MSDKTVLLVEDDASIRLVVSQTLVSAGYQVRATSSLDAMQRWVTNGEGDILISDVYVNDQAVFDVLPSIKLQRPELPVVVMSGQNTIMTAAAAAEHGAFDYLPKPFDIDDLTNLVDRALKPAALKSKRVDRDSVEAVKSSTLPLIGRSPAMQEVYRIITRVMQTKLTVLIEGESGTGKELAAKAIHQLGSDKGAPFRSLELSTMSDALLEKELSLNADEFSEEDSSGTLYLDEIGDLSPESQTRLVQLMRETEHARIIASTRKNLGELVAAGSFREDLYYRLNVVRLRMPPLRERKEDIPELAKAFLVRAEGKGLMPKTLEPSALDLLCAYDWPGNVRELENLILRLVALSPDVSISIRDVERQLRVGATQGTETTKSLEQEIRALLHRHAIADLMQESGEEGGKVYQSVIERVERPLITLALELTSGNKVKAAGLLGLNRNTLRAKITSLGIPET